MFRSKKHDLAVAAAEVVRQAEAVVGGRESATTGAAPAGRAWVSRLAHSGWEEMAVLARSQPRHACTWEGAGIYLAVELRDGAKGPDELTRLQRERLIPLELEMLAGHLDPPSTPTDLVRMVRVSSCGPGR